MADHNGTGPGGAPRGGDRDRIDTWLEEPVKPLLPPQGAFEQIRKRARRRKLKQAGVSAAGAVLLVAVGVAVPRLVIPHLGARHLVASSNTPVPHTHPVAPPTTITTPPSSEATAPTPIHTTPPPSTPPPAPGNFQVSSVTFVGTGTGWVIGQAGRPGHCGPPDPDTCTSIARTDDAGRSWYGVPAPVTGAPHGSRGVGQLRFLNTQDGWAFGPELWATSDGGQHWTRIATHGMRVVSLETSDGHAFAVWAHCGGSLVGLAVGCTGYSLYTSAAGSDTWTPVPGAAGLSVGSAPGAASLVLTGGNVYLFTPDGKLLSGPDTGAGPMTAATSGGTPTDAPCSPRLGALSGQPSQALLAATGSSGSGLLLLCPGVAAGGAQHKVLYYSSDGGGSWQHVGTAPRAGVATSLSGTPAGGVVLATSRGIEVAGSPGAAWQQAANATPPGGFGYVGMTTSEQGVAVPARTSLHGVWFTYDGGQSWRESRVP
jgi:hypothetical protein